MLASFRLSTIGFPGQTDPPRVPPSYQRAGTRTSFMLLRGGRWADFRGKAPATAQVPRYRSTSGDLEMSIARALSRPFFPERWRRAIDTLRRMP